MEGTEHAVRLIPKGGKSEDSKVSQENPIPQPEALESAKAVAEAMGENVLRLTERHSVPVMELAASIAPLA